MAAISDLLANLLRVQEAIEERGWGIGGETRAGCVSLTRVVSEVTDRGTPPSVYAALWERLFANWRTALEWSPSGKSDLEAWNADPDTTSADVLSMVDRAVQVAIGSDMDVAIAIGLVIPPEPGWAPEPTEFDPVVFTVEADPPEWRAGYLTVTTHPDYTGPVPGVRVNDDGRVEVSDRPHGAIGFHGTGFAIWRPCRWPEGGWECPSGHRVW